MHRIEINKLIAKYLLKEISHEEELFLEEWISDNENNKAFFERMCESDDISATYRNYKKLDTQEAYNKFIEKVNPSSRKFKLTPVYKIAAAVLLLVALTIPYLLYNQYANVNNSASVISPGSSKAILLTNEGTQIELDNDTIAQILSGNKLIAVNEEGEIAYNKTPLKAKKQEFNTLIVPRGGEYRITLSDGTKVHLNSESELRYPVNFNKRSREVYLKGEAYFEIAKSSNRPFYVIADDIKIKQYGTAFNVNNRNSQYINIALVHGSISVLTNNEKREYLLKPSQLAEYERNSRSVSVRTVDVEPIVAWNEGKFIFENKPLSEIMETLSLWYDIDFEFKKPTMAELKFTGIVSRSAPIQNILKAIEFATEAKITISNKTVSIDN